MNKTFIITMLISICLIVRLYGQVGNYKQDFVKPLRIEQSLSGNFGEPRSRHFHSGLDYRTYSDGKDVVSIADGYVSRVLVSPWGYGMALYVTHPNGYTSVYGHLSKFTPDIAKFVKEIQYSKQSFSIDTTLSENKFVFKRGQTIAYSGNTGFSEGPHLHFEIRETITEHPVNPLETVYHVKDNIAPEVSKVIVYPLSEKSIVGGDNYKRSYKLKKQSKGKYSIDSNIGVGGPIGIGVAYVDRMTGTHNRYGAEAVKLFVNGELVYHSVLDEIDFDKQRCKNSVFDYDYFLNDKLHVHKLYVEPNNDLKIFRYLVNDGVFYVPDGENRNVKIEIIDYSGNKSTVEFSLVGNDVCFLEESIEDTKLRWDEPNFLIEDVCRVEIDSAVLFHDQKIELKKVKESKYSPIFKIGEENIPVKKDFKVSFYIPDEFTHLADKMFIVRERKGKYRYITPEYSQQYISASSSYFGNFHLWVDTIPPKIIPQNIYKNKNMKTSSFIEVEIEDDFSGIAKFDMFINDTWVLGKYDPRKKQLRYYFDSEMPILDKYKLKVVVVDNTGNIGVFNQDFKY